MRATATNAEVDICSHRSAFPTAEIRLLSECNSSSLSHLMPVRCNSRLLFAFSRGRRLWLTVISFSVWGKNKSSRSLLVTKRKRRRLAEPLYSRIHHCYVIICSSLTAYTHWCDVLQDYFTCCFWGPFWSCRYTLLSSVQSWLKFTPWFSHLMILHKLQAALSDNANDFSLLCKYHPGAVRTTWLLCVKGKDNAPNRHLPAAKCQDSCFALSIFWPLHV